MNEIRQSVCLVVSPISVIDFASFFYCTHVELSEGPSRELAILVGAGPSLVCYLAI